MNKSNQSYRRAIALLIAILQTIIWPAAAQDTNTLEIIKQLQKRIEELEQKVKALEGSKRVNEETAEEKIKALEREREAAQKAQDEKIKQVQGLDQKVRALEQNRELDQEAAEARAKEAPKISIGGEGFSFATANGDFGVQLKGILQMDSRTFFDDGGIVGNDSFLLRRARPILQGTVFRDFDFLFVPEFGGTGSPQILDAYLNYRYAPWLQVQAGKYKAPLGLEQLQPDPYTLFNERSLVTALGPNRDVGAELKGDVFDGRISYAAGIFNGVGDGRNSSNADFEDDKAFVGRLFFQPFKKTDLSFLQGLGFGVAGSYENMQGTNVSALPATTGGSLAGYNTAGQQQFFAYNPTNRAAVVADGRHWRLSPQGYYYYGPFGFLGEYIISDQRVGHTETNVVLFSKDLQHTAWQVSGSWVLTGEAASYGNSVVPFRNFNPREGGWGAFQLVARYGELDLDRGTFPLFSDNQTSARSAKEWSVGLNWYLNRNVLFKTSFSHTDFSGGGGAGTSAPANVTRHDENVFFTRIQLAF